MLDTKYIFIRAKNFYKINQLCLKIYSATSINLYSTFKRDAMIYRLHLLKIVLDSINHIIQLTKIEMKL